MSYCIQADLLNEISEIELAQLTSESEVVDANVVSAKIADADSEIDSYLQKHYAVPLTTVPSVIRNASVKITLYHLFSRRANRVGGMDETVKDNYEKIIAWLKLAAKKEVTIGIDPLPGSPASTSEPVKVRTNERKYTKDTLSKF